MNRILTAALLATCALPLAACAEDYADGAPGYYGSAYAYDGYYDGYYGPIYDGYWGNDGYFYYRNGGGDRAYMRGDRGHFAREVPQGRGNFQPFHGSMTPDRGAHMPHFPHGGGGHGGGRGGGGGDHHP